MMTTMVVVRAYKKCEQLMRSLHTDAAAVTGVRQENKTVSKYS